MSFTPETLSRIENAVPIDAPATALDVWKMSGGISHQTVKDALRQLAERGRIARIKTMDGNSPRYFYQRRSRP